MQDNEEWNLIDEVAIARKLQTTLGELLSKLSIIDERTDLVFRYLSIARQHHDSIVLLIEQGANPSTAAALLRPLNETAQRGTWAASCASPEQIKTILTTDPDTFPGNPGKEIADMYGGESLPKELRATLHSFTHGGMQQLRRQYSTRGRYEAQFEYSLLAAFVRTSSTSLALLAVHASKAAERLDIADAIWRTYIQLFGDREIS